MQRKQRSQYVMFSYMYWDYGDVNMNSSRKQSPL